MGALSFQCKRAREGYHTLTKTLLGLKNILYDGQDL